MRSAWNSAAAASIAPVAARQRLLKARRRRPITRGFGVLRRARRGASRRPSYCRPLRRTMRHFAVAQLDKANAVCAKTEASRPDEGFCHAAPRLWILCLLPTPHSPTSFCEGTTNEPVGGSEKMDETPAAHLAPTRRATTTWTKQRARPPRVHTQSTGAAVPFGSAQAYQTPNSEGWQ
jgi:hypothetical protein